MSEEIGFVAKSPKLLDVFHSVVEFDRDGKRYRNHLLGIVFVVDGVREEDLVEDLRDGEDDVAEILVVSLREAFELDLTPIAKQALLKYSLS